MEPDYRFTLANERTFLAYERTAIGLVAASVAVLQIFEGWEHTLLGVAAAARRARWPPSAATSGSAGPTPRSGPVSRCRPTWRCTCSPARSSSACWPRPLSVLL